MSRPLEHNYISLSETPPMDISDKLISSKPSILKTDLSLGLPGCESPERKPGCIGVTLFGKELEGNTQNGLSLGSSKACSLGAKRGFSDTIHGSEKWVLSINGSSGSNMSKDGNLYSPREVVVPSTPKPVEEKKPEISAPAAKAQVVGWPPIRSYRKNTLASTSAKNSSDTDEKPVSACLYVKVSMDGAPYLRKVDIQTYRNYVDLSSALEKMFGCFITGKYGSYGHASRNGKGESHSTDHLCNSEYVLTYEDKDGDWMLVGDVPWRMFTENCRKLRIMKGSEAIGLTPKCN